MQINYRNADNSPVNVRFPDNFEDWVNQETCAATVYNRWKKIAHCSHCGHAWDYTETIYKNDVVCCPHCETREVAIPHTTIPFGTHQYFFWLWLEDESIYCASACSYWRCAEKNVEQIEDIIEIEVESINVINRDEQYSYGYILNWRTGEPEWVKNKSQHVISNERFVVDINLDDLIAQSFLKHMDIHIRRITGVQLSNAYFVNYLIDEMVFCARYPSVEYVKKSELGMLVEYKLEKIPTYIRPNWRARTIPELLRLSPQDIDKLKQWDYFNADGILRYKILKKQNKVKKEHMELCQKWIPDASFLCGIGYGYGWIKELRESNNLIQLFRYLEKQCKTQGNPCNRGEIGSLYKDYYVQLKELEYPQNDYYLYPKNLNEAHDKVSREYLEKKDAEKAKKYKKQQENYEKMHLPKLEEYVYQDNEYLIRPLRNCKEFEEEGRYNKNCVASYYYSVTEGVTSVFVLRRINEPNTPFITIELCDNHIHQCYGTGNRLPAPEVRKWVDDWLENTVKPRSKKKPKKGAA
nr:MAG TPA: PcfJ like protein [Caudoviricetes sp.]